MDAVAESIGVVYRARAERNTVSACKNRRTKRCGLGGSAN